LQKVYELFGRVRTQLLFALAPVTPDFDVYRPDSAYSAHSLGKHPWTLGQLENCLATHTDQVVTYIQSLSLEAFNICSREDVVTAVASTRYRSEAPEGVAASVDAGHAMLLTRACMHLKACLRSMVLQSADAFAARVKSYAGGAGADVVQAQMPIQVRCWPRQQCAWLTCLTR
jgi:hypothetical protein